MNSRCDDVLQRSAAEALARLPFVGQLLGRLCWIRCVTADGEFNDGST